MSHILIIGYGNPLRRDDGLGWHAAIRLSQSLHEDDVEVRACQQLTPELAEPISRVDRVLFIDACHARPAGRVFLKRVVPKQTAASPLAHTGSAASLMASVKALYGAEPGAEMLSVAGKSFDFGTELTPSGTKALIKIESMVRRWIHQESLPLGRRGGKSHA